MGLLGNETILMAGGGIYGHPAGAVSGAKALLQAIEAVMQEVPVTEAAPKPISRERLSTRTMAKRRSPQESAFI